MSREVGSRSGTSEWVVEDEVLEGLDLDEGVVHLW